MPVYLKESGKKYLVRIHVNGIPKTKTIYGTRREAEAFEARWRLELEAAGPTEYRTAPGFSEFCLGRYRLHAEAHLKAGTWRNRQYQIATLVEFFGNKPLDRITGADLERFQHARLRDVGAAKVNDDVKVLKAILNYAVAQGIPARVPKVRRLPERTNQGRVLVWSRVEVEALYRAFQREAPRLLPITVTMLNAGLRKGEALALEWSHVDLRRGLLLIHPSEVWQPKNGKPREVPIGAALRPWLEGPRESRRWVFPARRRRGGEPGRYATWPQLQWDRARKAARVGGVVVERELKPGKVATLIEGGRPIGGSPHVCRHTFASHFLAAVPDLFLLAEILGHSHTRVTQLYSHLLPDHLERARDAVSLEVPLAATPGRLRAVEGDS